MTTQTENLRIGIVGGSLAGCSAAILLSRAGHDVQVYERSRGNLVGRGGGIGTATAVFEGLIEQDIIDADFPHLANPAMPLLVRTDEQAYEGYSPWQIPFNFRVFHWSTLWNNLRKRVPDDRYYQGYEVATATQNNDETVTLQFKDGSSASFDLVLFADGYQSIGREMLFPDHELQYRGYMLWRGLLPESAMADSEPLGSNLPRISYPNLPGHMVMYFVPGQDGCTDPGRCIFNWAGYVPVPEEDLSEFMIGRNGHLYSGSLPPGQVRLEEEARLKQLMQDNLPDYYGEIVSKTEDTYVQLIYTVRLPAYHQGRICLIGDAGMVVQPFTGSGVFKGFNNVNDLIVALNSHETLAEALASWDKAQVRTGNRLLALGEQMEKAFIWEYLDLSTADMETTAAWYKASVAFPEEFTHEAKEA